MRMTPNQAFALQSDCIALTSVAGFVFALGSPSGTGRKVRFAGAAFLAFITAFWAALALVQSHAEVYSAAYRTQAPTCLAPLLAILLLCSLLLLGYALVKSPRHP
jgi:hypothetical protein